MNLPAHSCTISQLYNAMWESQSSVFAVTKSFRVHGFWNAQVSFMTIDKDGEKGDWHKFVGLT